MHISGEPFCLPHVVIALIHEKDKDDGDLNQYSGSGAGEK